MSLESGWEGVRFSMTLGESDECDSSNCSCQKRQQVPGTPRIAFIGPVVPEAIVEQVVEKLQHEINLRRRDYVQPLD